MTFLLGCIVDFNLLVSHVRFLFSFGCLVYLTFSVFCLFFLAILSRTEILIVTLVLSGFRFCLSVVDYIVNVLYLLFFTIFG